MPLDNEVGVNDLLLVEDLHEVVDELLLVWVLGNEVEDHCLDEVLDSNVSIQLDLVDEEFLIVSPVDSDVALLGEDPTDQDVVLDLVGELQGLLLGQEKGSNLTLLVFVICQF